MSLKSTLFKGLNLGGGDNSGAVDQIGGRSDDQKEFEDFMAHRTATTAMKFFLIFGTNLIGVIYFLLYCTTLVTICFMFRRTMICKLRMHRGFSEPPVQFYTAPKEISPLLANFPEAQSDPDLPPAYSTIDKPIFNLQNEILQNNGQYSEQDSSVPS